MRSTTISSLPLSVYVFILLFSLPAAVAQFGGFFQNGFPFGGHQHQHQQQQHDQGGRAHKGWHEMDSGTSYPRNHYLDIVLIEVHCRAGYVCPASLACVPTPADCPCPYPYVSFLLPAESMYADECSEDIKCVIPDTRTRDEGEGPPFVCVRGSCEEVVRLSKPI